MIWFAGIESYKMMPFAIYRASRIGELCSFRLASRFAAPIIAGMLFLFGKGLEKLSVQGKLGRPEWSHVGGPLGESRVKGSGSLVLPNGTNAIQRVGVGYRGRSGLGHHARFDNIGRVGQCCGNQRTGNPNGQVVQNR